MDEELERRISELEDRQQRVVEKAIQHSTSYLQLLEEQEQAPMRKLRAALALSIGNKAKTTMSDGSTVVIAEIFTANDAVMTYNLIHILFNQDVSVYPDRSYAEAQDRFEVLCAQTGTDSEHAFDQHIWLSI